MFTPQLELETQFVLDGRGRITSTREPNPTRGPKFSLIRGVASCAWAVHADVSDALAAELCAFASREPAHEAFRDPPMHADRYGSLLGGRINFGPAFTFPDTLPDVSDVAELRDASLLDRFRGWTADEIPERAPICAVMDGGRAASVCFCARLSPFAAEAGLETAAEFRGRGFGPRVTAAWARAIRASGRLPIYSTSWSNEASRAVARKLGLVTCATNWSLS